MKLTPKRIARAARQFDAWPLPDDHLVTRFLNELFGDHTFFLDDEGLSIVESALPEVAVDVELGRVVKLAKWVDARRIYLAPHPREFTNIVVALSEAA